MDGTNLSLGISNPNSGEILSLENFELGKKPTSKEIIDFLSLEKSKALLANSSVNQIYTGSEKFTIIPSVFFVKDKQKGLVSSVFKLDEEESLFNQYIPELDSYMVFASETNLVENLKSSFGHIEVCHQFTPLISAYHLYYIEDNEPKAFIHLRDGNFALSLFRNKKMELFNVFDHNSFEDVCYYTYFGMEQFGFNPEKTAIHISGYSEFSEELSNTLKKYTQNIFHLKPNKLENIPVKDSDKLISTIFDLQCG